MTTQQKISIIVPVHTEERCIQPLYEALITYTAKLPYIWEFIFVDDGSRDKSAAIIKQLTKTDDRVRLIEFARNFGKEAAVSAGLHHATGDAAIMMDADLQHPPHLLGQFIDKWKAGADVVVGVRRYNKKEGAFKRFSSHMFYKIFGAIAHTEITPHATDYRLLDRRVLKVFNKMTERNRITRGLIDWLGFRRDYLYFESPPRKFGERAYSYTKLIALAVNSFTAYSLVPLRLAGYVGVVILTVSGPLGIFLYIEKYIMNDPLSLNVTGTAMLAIMLLFLVGIMLVSLGLVALYIAHIHAEVTNRPLYVVRDMFGQPALEEAE